MRSTTKIIATMAFSLAILCLPAIASAQYRQNDPYGDQGRYGNGGYNNGGYYGGNYGDIRGTVRDLKMRAERFDRLVDDQGYNGGGRGGWWGGNNGRDRELQRLASDFRRATDRFEDKYGRGRNLNNSADEARRVLDIASQIDQRLRGNRGGGNLRSEWSQIEQSLRVVARTYGFRYNGGGYNNYPGPRGNGGGRFPWPF